MYVMEYWKQFGHIDDRLHYLMALIYSIIALFSLISNTLVIIYLTKMRKSSNNRNGSWYFLINLAIADCGKSVIGLPLLIVSSLYRKWVFGQIGCSIYGFTYGLFGFVSLSTLCLMCVERYLIVSNPFKSLGTKFKIISILIIWLYSSIWVTIQFGSEHGYVLEGFLTSCSFDYFSRDYFTRIYMMLMIVCGFFVPLSFLTFFMILTKKSLETYSKNFERNFLNLTSPSNILMNSMEDFHNHINKKSKQSFDLNKASIDLGNRRISFQNRHNKVLRSIILYVTFFCISWTPYVIIVLLAQFGSNIQNYIDPYTTSFPALIAKFSSIHNPILFTLSNKECRNYFKNLIFKQK